MIEFNFNFPKLRKLKKWKYWIDKWKVNGTEKLE